MSFEDFRKDWQIKKATGILLQHDAETVYRAMWLFDKSKAPAVAGTDGAVPPRIDMYYWNQLNKDHSFLLLARDDRFAKIFQDFWALEEINSLSDKGRAGDKESARMAMTAYHDALRRQAHRELLSQFMTAEQIDESDRIFSDRMAESRTGLAAGKAD
jgi:hypothetical protein